MVNPNDIEVSGWDVSSLDVYESCRRAHVLEPTLLDQLKDDLQAIKPLPAALNGEYIAGN